MSLEENINQKTKKKRKRRIDKPVVIAFFIVLLSVVVLVCWQVLFDTNIKGSWKLEFEEDGKNYSYGFTFGENNTFSQSFGGIKYSGTYTLDPSASTLSIKSVTFGNENVNTQFQYEVSGNVFDGKTLVLTNAANNKLPFVNSEPFEPDIKKYDDFKPDDKLTGIWLYKNDDTGYSYTFTFHKDGTYEYLYDGVSYYGAYKVKDGVYTYNITSDDGTVNENQFNYAVDGDKLTVYTDYYSDVFVRTDNKYAYIQEVK